MKENFVDVIALSAKICSAPIKGNLSYAKSENFLGRVVKGYYEDASDVCLLTKAVAETLCLVQNHLVENYNLGLLIHDAYRPLKAVKDFGEWAKQPPINDYELERKKIHYPNIEKTDLDKLGYVLSTISRHCFGNAVDVTLISLENGKEIPMGCVFDFFDELSHPTANVSQIGEEALKNRNTLIETMKLFNFEVYDVEYWHFDFYIREIDEPADFDITKSLKKLGEV
ncbi:MAG: peptidase M15 [Rickettsiales bacterium]|nr:MAG: peptidase M15 [Rickettsiales bacterium]